MLNCKFTITNLEYERLIFPLQIYLEATGRVRSRRQYHAQVLVGQWFEFNKVLQASLAGFVVDVFRATLDCFVGVIVWKAAKKN